METIEKRTLDAAKNVCLSSVLCFITGCLYSLGIFSTFVEEAASPPGSLDAVWSAGMALISFCCMPFMFFTGVYLSQGSDSSESDQVGVSRSSRARLLAAAGSVFYALLAVSGLGVSMSSALLIQVSFIPVGLAMGLFYVLSMELMAVWVPHRPGLAVGIGQMMFGAGSIVSASVFEYLVQNYTTPNALYMAAAFLSLPTAVASGFLEWPGMDYVNGEETSETNGLVEQAGYAFIAYYFQIGQTFGKKVSTVVRSFQAANIAGTLLRPLTGAIVDVLKTREGFFSLGSKNVILVLLVGQGVCFLGLIGASWRNWFEGYAIFAGTIVATFAAGSCCAPLLAREQFGGVNSSVVFGMGGSISMGLGETVAVLMMAGVEWSSSKTDVPSAYQGYYILSFVWSVFGLVTCLLLKAHKPSYFEEMKEGSCYYYGSIGHCGV